MSALISVRNLNKSFSKKPGLLSFLGFGKNGFLALDDVSLDIYPGEILGLVGESGSGKTTLTRTILRLTEPDGGTALYRQSDIFKLTPEQIKLIIRKDIRMIFQHPDASLNPSYTVKMVFDQANKTNQSERHPECWYETVLQSVGLDKTFLHKMPHELSGGEKRRINICRALLTKPQLIFADEPTSGLDLYLQHQILKIMCEIRDLYNLSIVLISHDVELVKKIADRMCIMHKGRIVEIGPNQSVSLENASHPYTRDLYRSDLGFAPDVAAGSNELLCCENNNGHAGCLYYKNCLKFQMNKSPDVCLSKRPRLREIGKNHFAACHFI